MNGSYLRYYKRTATHGFVAIYSVITYANDLVCPLKVNDTNRDSEMPKRKKKILITFAVTKSYSFFVFLFFFNYVIIVCFFASRQMWKLTLSVWSWRGGVGEGGETYNSLISLLFCLSNSNILVTFYRILYASLILEICFRTFEHTIIYCPYENIASNIHTCHKAHTTKSGSIHPH